MWWNTPVIPSNQRWRKEDQMIKVIFCHIANSGQTGMYENLCRKEKEKKKLLGPSLTAVNNRELIVHIQDSFLWCSYFTPSVSWAGTPLFKNACFPPWFSVSGSLPLPLFFFFFLSWLMDAQYIYGSHSAKSSPPLIPEVTGHPQQISSIIRSSSHTQASASEQR